MPSIGSVSQVPIHSSTQSSLSIYYHQISSMICILFILNWDTIISVFLSYWTSMMRIKSYNIQKKEMVLWHLIQVWVLFKLCIERVILWMSETRVICRASIIYVMFMMIFRVNKSTQIKAMKDAKSVVQSWPKIQIMIIMHDVLNMLDKKSTIINDVVWRNLPFKSRTKSIIWSMTCTRSWSSDFVSIIKSYYCHHLKQITCYAKVNVTLTAR